METESDRGYLQRVMNGETSAYSYIVDKYKDMVFGICLKICREREQAEEIAQDTFVKAFNNLDSFRMESKFSTWLYRIAYNTSISAVRKKKVEFAPVDDHIVQNYTIEEINTDIQGCDREVVQKKLLGMIDELPDNDRAIVQLFYLEQTSIDDISEMTQLSKSNIKVKLHRIRKRLYNDLSSFLKAQVNVLNLL